MSDMDRETRDHYAVVIQAKDMAGSVGGLSGSTTVNITLSDVNDNPPKFSQSKCSPSFSWSAGVASSLNLSSICAFMLQMLSYHIFVVVLVSPSTKYTFHNDTDTFATITESVTQSHTHTHARTRAHTHILQLQLQACINLVLCY